MLGLVFVFHFQKQFLIIYSVYPKIIVVLTYFYLKRKSEIIYGRMFFLQINSVKKIKLTIVSFWDTESISRNLSWKTRSNATIVFWNISCFVKQKSISFDPRSYTNLKTRWWNCSDKRYQDTHVMHREVYAVPNMKKNIEHLLPLNRSAPFRVLCLLDSLDFAFPFIAKSSGTCLTILVVLSLWLSKWAAHKL